MTSSTDQKAKQSSDPRVPMANERTFLAWVRTSIAIMAFGFVVERFSLFLQQFALYFGKEGMPAPHGYSQIIGIVLVGLGPLTGVLAYLRYRRSLRRLEENDYRPAGSLPLFLTLTLALISAILIVYLVHSIR